jgi:hypothetical protein
MDVIASPIRQTVSRPHPVTRLQELVNSVGERCKQRRLMHRRNRNRGIPLAARAFPKDACVRQGEIVENKILGSTLDWIRAQQRVSSSRTGATDPKNKRAAGPYALGAARVRLAVGIGLAAVLTSACAEADRVPVDLDATTPVHDEFDSSTIALGRPNVTRVPVGRANTHLIAQACVRNDEPAPSE